MYHEEQAEYKSRSEDECLVKVGGLCYEAIHHQGEDRSSHDLQSVEGVDHIPTRNPWVLKLVHSIYRFEWSQSGVNPLLNTCTVTITVYPTTIDIVENFVLSIESEFRTGTTFNRGAVSLV